MAAVAACRLTSRSEPAVGPTLGNWECAALPAMTATPSVQLAYSHIHSQLVLATADDHAAERGYVGEIAAPGERYVIFADHAVIGRIEIDPAMRRAVDRHPGMGGIPADQRTVLSGAGGSDVSAHVAGGET